MNILICPDKYKGTLTALEAATALAAGVRRALPSARVALCPIADGGEGTVESLCSADGRIVRCPASDALGRPIDSFFGKLPDGTAVIELAVASGLSLIPEAERSPLHSGTFGTGQLLVEAIRGGAKRLLIGLGGSATNDAGAGIAQAFGYRFLDADSREVNPVPANFDRVMRILPPNSPPKIPSVVILSDVTNPLTGPTGATRVFGIQKGIPSDLVESIDRSLFRFSELAGALTGRNFRDHPGAGAAGGAGFGLMTFLGAEMRSGFEYVAEAIGLERKIREADLVITGEGSLDAQSASGKGPWRVAQLAQKWERKVVCVPGIASDSEEVLSRFDRVIPLVGNGVTAEQAKREAARVLESRIFDFLLRNR